MNKITRSLTVLTALGLLLSGCGGSPTPGTGSTTAGTSSPTAPGTTAPSESGPTPSGVFIEYFSSVDCTRSVGVGSAKQIDFDFASGKAPIKGAPRNHYSLRIVGQLTTDEGGEYTLTTEADDGVQLELDGKTIISDIGPHTEQQTSATVTLEAGKHYPYTLTYYNGDAAGVLRLFWQKKGGKKVLIPADNLLLPEDRTLISLSDTDDGVEAVALSGWQDDYRLVLEKSDGSSTTPTFGVADGSSKCALPANNGDRVQAYIIDKEMNRVSNITTKVKGADRVLTIDPTAVAGELSPYLTGACMEDVNHEVYGGIWSQMIFGESFAENPSSDPLEGGLESIDGSWTVVDQNLSVEKKGDGAKLVVNGSEGESGQCSVKLKISGEGPVGFLLKTSDARPGADSFVGYEIGIGNNFLRIGRHNNDYRHISDTPCTAPAGEWVELKVVYTSDSFTVYVGGEEVASYTDPAPFTSGAVGLRAWNAAASFTDLIINEKKVELNASSTALSCATSWKIETSGNVNASANLISKGAFKDERSQRLTFTSGSGRLILSNYGLNHKGMGFVADKDYEGYLYAGSAKGCDILLTLSSADGSKTYASKKIHISGDYQKYSFSMTPNTTDAAGRFSIVLESAGSVDLGYVYLSRGEWGCYKGLPVRADVAKALEESKITVLRYGGCMANASEYRWKKMLGAPEFRPIYSGWWYGPSSNGFGIIEFLDLCEALGVLGIPDFNSYESPEDMADFVRFALGTDSSDPWVAKRIEMGHPDPYPLTMIEIGNEEKVDAAYAARFNAIADAVWAVAPELTLVVGDFQYNKVIEDPYNFTGCDSGITTLANHKTILDHAVNGGHAGKVWFDIHWWCETGLQPASLIDAALSLHKHLTALCPDANPKFCVFELNANRHTFERALCNAYAMAESRAYPDIFPIICSANCLQVDKCNDNGWDQGLVFMNSDSVWLQPPAYIAQMIANSTLKNRLKSIDAEPSVFHSFTASVSEDGKTVSLLLINRSGKAVDVALDAKDCTGRSVLTYSGELSDKNTASAPTDSCPGDPVETTESIVELPAYSVVVVTLKF